MEYVEVFGFENIYRVNKNGDIHSLRYKKNLKPKINQCGYCTVCLIDKNKRYYKMVHRVVFESFKNKIGKGMQINHIDGNKKNNRLENLEEVTPSENLKHAFRIGLKSLRGNNHNNNKLNWDDVCAIRESKLLGVELARKYKVSTGQISLIRNYKNWRNRE